MNQYNQQFKMSDFFLNKKLSGLVPQFDRHDLERGEPSDYKIFTRCRTVLNGFLGGDVRGETIEVSNKSMSSVMSIVRACKSILEAMFDNSKALMRNLKSDKKLYTSVASISQVAELTDNRKKLKVLQEILDNLNYNPDFGCQNCVQSFSSLPFSKRQELWKKKVGYKE